MDDLEIVEEKYELSESEQQELYDEMTYECVTEMLEIFRTYVYEKGIPIGERITYVELFEFFFK